MIFFVTGGGVERFTNSGCYQLREMGKSDVFEG